MNGLVSSFKSVNSGNYLFLVILTQHGYGNALEFDVSRVAVMIKSKMTNMGGVCTHVAVSKAIYQDDQFNLQIL